MTLTGAYASGHTDAGKTLAGKLAVVTGGSSGIGAACARMLASHGARLIVGYNQGAERAEELRASLPGEGHRCLRIPLVDDSGQGDFLTHVVSALREEGGRVDILINSAGFTRRIPHGDLETLDPALFNEILVANAGGTYAITRALIPFLRESGDAVVINISSVSAFTGLGSNIAYCASKAAMDVMTQSFARAFGHGIRFLCLSPASVDTDFIAGRNRDELQAKAEKTPLGRIVTPEDVADAALACITLLRTATGSRIVIDGGHVL